MRSRAHSLVGCFFAVAFGAWFFFLCASIQADPTLGALIADIGTLLAAMQVLVVTVAVGTSIYALSVLLRERGRELGLLQLLGLGQRALGVLIGWETFFLGMGAAAVGIMAGALTGKLWYMGFSRALALDQPLRFTMQSTALLQTVILFGLLFGSAGLVSAYRLGRRPIAEMLRAQSRRDGALRVSRPLVLLCLVVLAAALGLIGTLTVTSPDWQLPVGSVALILGTYLLYTQGGVALLAWLRGRRLYWRSTNLLLLSGLGHRLRENARLLWLVTILASVTILMAGLFTGYFLQIRSSAEVYQKTDIILMPGRGGLPPITPAQVRTALTAAGIQPEAERSITVGLYKVEGTGYETALLSWSSWETWRDLEPDLPHLSPDQVATFANPLNVPGVQTGAMTEELRRRLPPALQPEAQSVNSVHLMWGLYGPAIVMVVPDQTWGAVDDSFDLVEVTGWRQADWFGQSRQVADLSRTLGPWREVRPQLLARGQHYWQNRTDGGLYLFVLALMSLLFLLSSGAILTFKLFMDLQGDRLRFGRLVQIGLAPAELGRLIWYQSGFLFLTPLLLAGLYGGAGVLLIGKFMAVSLWKGGLIALGLYAGLQFLYWFVAARSYGRMLRSML